MHLANVPDLPDLPLVLGSPVTFKVSKMADAANKYQVFYHLLELRFTILCPTSSHYFDTSALVLQVHLISSPNGHWPCLSCSTGV